jgi:hypothetical protein
VTREAPDPFGASPRNPLLQALAGLLLAALLAMLLASLWPRLARPAVAAAMLAWAWLGARAAAFAWRAARRGAGGGRGSPLLLPIATGMAALAVCGLLGGIALLAA